MSNETYVRGGEAGVARTHTRIRLGGRRGCCGLISPEHILEEVGHLRGLRQLLAQ